VASDGLSLVLALEIAPSGRTAADRDGPPCADPADEHPAEQLGVFEWNHVETATVAREKPRLIR
jgi:hypothetical protein